MAECEALKISLLAKDIQQPKAHTYNRPAEAVRIEDSGKLNDIDWDAGASVAADMFGAAAAAGAVAASAPPLPTGALELGADLEWPPRSASHSSAGGSGAMVSAGAAGGGYGVGGAQLQASTSYGSTTSGSWPEPVSYSSHYTPSNAQLLQKHSLFAPRTGSGNSTWQQQQQASSRVRYPSFNANPIDAVWAVPPAAAAAASSGGGSGGPSSGGAPPDLSSLSLAEQQLMQPSAGPSLGPQEVEVQNMSSCHAQPGGNCAAPPPPPPQQQQVVHASRESAAEAAAAAAAGPKSLSKRIDLRDVHISVALMNDFLHFAANNTRR